MHLFFSGIGGTAIGPLALIAKQAGYEVSGSDKQNSKYIDYLIDKGITDIHIGQTEEALADAHKKSKIDWFVYSSAVEKEDNKHPEITFVDKQGIKKSKRDELLNLIIKEKALKMIAIAGTHGKTTTTAMVVWLFKQLGLPVSYSVGAKISFGDMGQYDAASEYFVYEADEFDRNFLAFEPHASLITGVTYDHHEIFPTRADYKQAFVTFIGQSKQTFVWKQDFEYLELQQSRNLEVLDENSNDISKITLAGKFNRHDAWLAIQAVKDITRKPVAELMDLVNSFPGSQRRMEQIVPNLYSDYAHTPEKIRGAMSVATEMAQDKAQDVVVVYEGLTNRRQHYMKDDYGDCFEGAKKLYWIPSYLAREDPDQAILEPAKLIKHISNPEIAEPMKQDERLKKVIQQHIDDDDMVVAMTGGGGGSLDEWLRQEFSK